MTKKVDTTPTVFGRTEFFRLSEPEVKKTPVIEAINASVYCKNMNAADKSSYDFSMMKMNMKEGGSPEADLRNLNCKYLVRVLCNSKGVRLFTDEEADVLGKKKPGIISAIHKAVQKELGDDVNSEEEMEKNLGETPQGDSPSASV